MATISLRVPDELLARIDEVAKLEGRNRTAWLLDLVESEFRVPAAEEASVRDLPDPEKPRKMTPAELVRKRAMYRRQGWVLADFSVREESIGR